MTTNTVSVSLTASLRKELARLRERRITAQRTLRSIERETKIIEGALRDLSATRQRRSVITAALNGTKAAASNGAAEPAEPKSSRKPRGKTIRIVNWSAESREVAGSNVAARWARAHARGLSSLSELAKVEAKEALLKAKAKAKASKSSKSSKKSQAQAEV